MENSYENSETIRKNRKMSDMLDQSVNDLNDNIKTLVVLREKVGKLFPTKLSLHYLIFSSTRKRGI